MSSFIHASLGDGDGTIGPFHSESSKLEEKIKTFFIESAKLGVINEGVITLDDSEDDTANSQDVIVEEKPKSRGGRPRKEVANVGN